MFQPLGSNLLKTSQIQFEQTTKQTPENIPEFYIQWNFQPAIPDTTTQQQISNPNKILL